MTARITIPSATTPAATTPAAATADSTTPALNRAARRARRKGGTQPLPAAGVPSAYHGAVSTKSAHHRTDFAARRSG